MISNPSPHFDKALAFVLKAEGGFVDNPADPGGRTNMGITQSTYSAWKRHEADVKYLELDEAAAIYRERYWTPAGCEDQPWPLCLVHFDTAVNCGPARAARWLDESHGDVHSYLWFRHNHYVGLAARNPKLSVFLKGWMNRLDALQEAAKEKA